MLLIHGPGSEKQAPKAPCHQLHLSGAKEHEACGDFCGAGLEVAYIIFAHVLFTRTQEMAVPNSWEARKFKLAMYSGRRNVSS